MVELWQCWPTISMISERSLSRAVIDLPHSWPKRLPGLTPGLRPVNKRRRYKVTPSLISWARELGATLEQALYHARTHFRERRGIFSMGAAKSRKRGVEKARGKRVILKAWVCEILKKGKILHVFITICLFRMFELLCINVGINVFEF